MLGIRTMHAAPDDQIPPPGMSAEWDLFSAGVFEQDAEMVGQALRLPTPPRQVCAVAAGVREFGHAVDDPEGVFGIAQWFPGRNVEVALGTIRRRFRRRLRRPRGRRRTTQRYRPLRERLSLPAARGWQGSTSRGDLWAAAADLETSTLFGDFKIDLRSGAQVKHRTVLVRWAAGKPAVLVSTPTQATN